MPVWSQKPGTHSKSKNCGVNAMRRVTSVWTRHGTVFRDRYEQKMTVHTEGEKLMQVPHSPNYLGEVCANLKIKKSFLDLIFREKFYYPWLWLLFIQPTVMTVILGMWRHLRYIFVETLPISRLQDYFGCKYIQNNKEYGSLKVLIFCKRYSMYAAAALLMSPRLRLTTSLMSIHR